ncbi:GDYXXLXY domain-containing protein [Pelistega sp. MC2]|uniref:GDYXXLXY domain-containing protein n=1 Tax=Pelistega sp. MC2 TaxID=1720297 RepID=UPI0008DA557E|nr:GDYXXLXY domain-containing protein [Pelistega sp. MC2]
MHRFAPHLFTSLKTHLSFITLLMGVGFASSGIITWIAANWSVLSNSQKLYGTQGLFFLCVIMSFFLYKKQWFSGSQGVAFLSVVIIGGLFALIGQIYQTGANAWELFAIWSLLQIPLIVTVPNPFNLSLLIITSTLSLLFYQQYISSLIGISLLIIGLFFLTVSEVLRHFTADTQWRLTQRISSFIVLCGSIYILESVAMHSLIIGLSCVLLFFYTKILKDVVISTIAILTIFATLLTSILNHFNIDFDGESLLLLSCLLIIMCIAGIFYLLHYFHNQQQDQDIHWAIQSLFVILMSIAFIPFVGGILYFISSSDTVRFVIPAIGLYLCGFFLYQHQSSLIKTLFSQVLITLSLGLFLSEYLLSQTQFSPLSLTPDLYAEGFSILISPENIRLFFYILLSVFTFIRIDVLWIRLLCINMMLFLFYDGIANPMMFLYQSNLFTSSLFLVLFNPLLLTLVSGVYTVKKPSVQSYAVFLGLIFYSFITSPIQDIIHNINVTSYGFSDNDHNFFHHITGDLFIFSDNQPLAYYLNRLPLYLMSLAPAFTMLYITKGLSIGTRLLSITLALLFGVLWILSPRMNLCACIILLAFPLTRSGLLWLAITAMLVLLSCFYYNLDTALIYKSYLLLGLGIPFLLILTVTRHHSSPKPLSLPSFSLPAWSKIGYIATLCLTLGIANYAINRHENILNNGQSLIFKLSPTDPRSLMQGDYMELNYEELTVSSTEELTYAPSFWHQYETSYFLFTLDDKGIAHTCSISSSYPKHFAHCHPNLVMKVKRDYNGRHHFPSHQYFFAEGKAEHFAQAEYGEFKVDKNGNAVLKQLLDENLTPL